MDTLSKFRSAGVCRLLGVLLLMLSLAGCGLVGGEEEDEDGKYPEPPGRPSAAMVETPAH